MSKQVPWLTRTQSNPRFFYGWVVVAAAGLIQITSQGLGGYLFPLLLIPMQSGLGWSRTDLSGAYSVGYIVLAVVMPGVGHLVDRRGARGYLALGALISAICLLGIAAMDQLWEFFLLWGIGLGLAQALSSVQVGSTAIANWFSRRRGTALAWLAVMMGLAPLIFVPIATWLILRFGWRSALVILALGFLVIPLPLSFLVRRRPEDMGLHPDGRHPDGQRIGREPATTVVKGHTVGEAMRTPALWALSLSSLLPAIAWGIVNTHQIAFMIDRGFTEAIGATVISVAALASLPARFGLNAAGDRFGAKRMLILVIALQAIAIVILLEANSLFMLFCYAIVYGASTGAAFGLRSALLGDLYGRRAFGAIAGVHGSLIYLGGAVGPVLAGVMFDRLHDYRLAFTLAAVFTAASILGLLLLPARDAKRHPIPVAPIPPY